MVKKIVFFAVLVFSVMACFSVEQLENDLVGSWRSKEGATLVLRSDSTFSVFDLPVEVTASDYNYSKMLFPKGFKLTYAGYWEAEEASASEKFRLHTVRDSTKKVIYESVEFIVLRGGFFQTGPPNRIQIFLDSDGLDVCEFRRDTVKQ